MADRFNNSVQPLEDRIRALHAEIDGIMEDRIVAEAAAHPNIPTVVLRKILSNGTFDCRCRQYLRLLEQD
jgi:hypothetical protein